MGKSANSTIHPSKINVEGELECTSGLDAQGQKFETKDDEIMRGLARSRDRSDKSKREDSSNSNLRPISKEN